MKQLQKKSLFSRDTGYRLEYYDMEGNVKCKQLKAKTLKEADTMAFNFLLLESSKLIIAGKDMEIKQTENKYAGVRNHVIGTEIVNTYKSLLDVYDDFLSTKKSLSKRSYDDYKRLGTLLFDNMIRWEHLTVDQIISLQKRLLNEISHEYIANHMILFSVFLKFCRDSQYISKNITDPTIASLFKKQKHAKTPAIPMELLEKICNEVTDKDFSLLLELMLKVSARPTEIIKLSKDCLIPHTKKIRIMQFKTGKYIHFTLSDELYNRCKAHFLLSTTEYAFHHGHKNRYYNDCWNQIMIKLELRLQKKGVAKNMYDMRQIRHTSLTEAYKRTNNREIVRKRAGHTDQRMTNRYIDPYCDNRTLDQMKNDNDL